MHQTIRVLIFAMALSRLSGSSTAEEVLFNRDVRPILSEFCFACHGPDSGHRKADLRLDLRADAVDSRAIVPGDSAASEMIRRIMSDDAAEMMPPTESLKTLDPRQKTILRKWIESGAEYQQHWAYEPPVRPETRDRDTAIDELVQVAAESAGIVIAAEADRRTLIRRVSVDLTGLPPTPEDVRRFLADTSSDAWVQLVSRLLKSPHYGERMAMSWLDVVRYADTIGYHSDVPRNVWPYRDWVIRSFSENKRFDRFTREQIAGDLLPDASQETRVGSAFNRLVLSTEEGGAQPKDYEARMLADRVRAIGTAWLGQTTGCAQCHDHKFDPFTTKDFYSLGAFFADIQEDPVGRREDGMPVLTAEDQTQLESLEQKILAETDPGKVALLGSEKKRLLEASARCLVSVSAAKKRTVRVLPRGNWMDDSGEIVSPAVPGYLPQPNNESRELTRLDLANWLVSPDNPLTARVVMNRLWKHFFGIGLSRNAEDLGAQGELPPNQPLLDWLAREFMESGWDYQHMVRLIVLSQTYRRSSTVPTENLAIDPDNRLNSRQGRFRLDAELIRDNALAVSGLLVPQIGGPSVRPYQPAGYWENLNFPTREYVPDTGNSQYRRGLYTWWQRSFLHPSLLAFDAPNREECTADRSRSNIPQQALTLLNDPSYVEAFRAFATKALRESRGTRDDRIVWMWQQALQRNPNAAELQKTGELFEYQAAQYRMHVGAAEAFLNIGLSPVPADIPAEDLAAWTHVARVLLNLHESITRN